MKINEWKTLKSLLSIELENAARRHKFNNEIQGVLSDLYFEWIAKVERHIWITESGEREGLSSGVKH